MRSIVVFILFLLGTGTAAAAPLTYSEAVSGDLSSADTLTFGEGANTVSGTRANALNVANSDFDGFSFVIPDGYELISATYYVDGFQQSEPGDVRYFALGASITKDGILQGSGGNAVLYSGGMKVADAVLVTIYDGAPLGAGLYKISEGSGRSADPALILFADYVLTFNVASVSDVPVPAAFLLMLSGLAGLGLMKRKNS